MREVIALILFLAALFFLVYYGGAILYALVKIVWAL